MFTCPRGSLEIIEGIFSLGVIRSLINPLQAFGDLLAIFPAADVQGMEHKVHDAG